MSESTPEGLAKLAHGLRTKGWAQPSVIADGLDAAAAEITRLRAEIEERKKDRYEQTVNLREANDRELALEEEITRLRGALRKAHDHMHRLCAIIPGNDEAYAQNVEIMAEIRLALSTEKDR